MAINVNRYNSPATKGEVAGVALQLSVAVEEMIAALETIKNGNLGDLDRSIASLKEADVALTSVFDTLSGWTDGA